ncbi:MAG UNVERIFIED_CONTAM: hypothetical protein LVR18_48800 [Planctomycetaceae bacterium]|jgi:hypothetical protein
MNRLLTALVISGLLSTGCETQTTTPARSSATESSTTSSETPEKPIDPPESADSSAAVAPVAPDAAPKGANERVRATGAENELKLSGILLKKDWTKTFESWQAGGSEYYVLQAENTPDWLRTAKEGAVLIPTEKVPATVLDKFVGRPVNVTGRYFPGTLFKAPDHLSQYPSGAVEQQYYQGKGVRLSAIASGEDGVAP